MERKKKARKAEASPYLVYLLNGYPKTGPFCQNISLNENYQQIFCYCLFYDVNLIMVDLTELCTEH